MIEQDVFDARNDPAQLYLNRPDDPEYIARLVGQVVAVSVATAQVVAGLPDLGCSDETPLMQ